MPPFSMPSSTTLRVPRRPHSPRKPSPLRQSSSDDVTPHLGFASSPPLSVTSSSSDEDGQNPQRLHRVHAATWDCPNMTRSSSRASSEVSMFLSPSLLAVNIEEEDEEEEQMSLGDILERFPLPPKSVKIHDGEVVGPVDALQSMAKPGEVIHSPDPDSPQVTSHNDSQDKQAQSQRAEPTMEPCPARTWSTSLSETSSKKGFIEPRRSYGAHPVFTGIKSRNRIGGYYSSRGAGPSLYDAHTLDNA